MSSGSYQLRFGGRLSPAVKTLLAVNFAIFILQQILSFIPHTEFKTYEKLFESIFGLSHTGFVNKFFLWQPFTYMFLHGGWLHIFFNLFTLWMFAGELERHWGTARFVKYYITAGIGAGFFIALMNFYLAVNYPLTANVPTIGASGALYALLLAYGILWPNRVVLLYFLFPIKIKYLLLFFGLIEFFGTLNSFTGTIDNVSHIGHLGGIIVGFFLLKILPKIHTGNINIFSRLARKFVLRKRKKVIDTRIKAKDIIDRLLDKIAREGISSLTESEKRDLDWARKNYYPSDTETMH